MTLNGYVALNSLFAPVCLAPDRATFENNFCVKTNKDRPILGAARTFSRDSSFWRYKIFVDILGSSLETRCQRRMSRTSFLGFRKLLSCSLGNLVSGDIKFVRIFAGIL